MTNYSKSYYVRDIMLNLSSLIKDMEGDLPTNLDGYMNEKELQYIGHLRQEVGSVIPSLISLMVYLEHVKPGTYDGDRRGVRDMIRENEEVWESVLGLLAEEERG